MSQCIVGLCSLLAGWFCLKSNYLLSKHVILSNLFREMLENLSLHDDSVATIEFTASMEARLWKLMNENAFIIYVY
eukprot:c39731_g1_i1 orf=72-299(+)